MLRRVPSWACPKFRKHGPDHVCGACLGAFLEQGPNADDSCLPPLVTFARGWLSVGATHWFGATDETTFPSCDGTRLLAQTVCGAICEVTLAFAPRVGRECKKCVAALHKLGFDIPKPADDRHISNASIDHVLRGVRNPIRFH